MWPETHDNGCIGSIHAHGYSLPLTGRDGAENQDVQMKSRRKAREVVLQALYQCDTLNDWSEEIVERFFSNFFSADPETSVPGDLAELERENIKFAREIIRGVCLHLNDIDTEISAISMHWTLARMARVDRNILRLAAYEMLFISDIPLSVTINEAIEIAKRFAGDDSPMFINGVLDQLAGRNGLKEAKRAP